MYYLSSDNILTWNYDAGDLAPWDYDEGILGGMGIDDARVFLRTFAWVTPAKDDPAAFETAFTAWQRIAIDDATDGTVTVCRGTITVRRDGKWVPATALEIAAGPLSYDDAKIQRPNFNVRMWFGSDWMHAGIDGAWYILRHHTSEEISE